MAGSVPSRTDGLHSALAIHLALYCVVGAFFAFGFYLLLQPSYTPNPGLAAYKPPPATVMTFRVPPPRQPDEDLTTGHADGSQRTAVSGRDAADSSASGQKDARPAEQAVKSAEVKSKKAKRARTVSRKPRRSPYTNYAAQPYNYYNYAAQPFGGGFRF